jgi:hypothetical protein
VDLRYPKDAKVMLVDTGLVVRLGDKNYADRFARAVRTLDAARRGDTDTLTSLNIRGTRLADLIARTQWIEYVDAADDSGRMTVAYSREAPPPPVEVAAPARDAEKPAAAQAAAAPKPAAKAAEKPAAKQASGSPSEARPRKVSEPSEKRDTGRTN